MKNTDITTPGIIFTEGGIFRIRERFNKMLKLFLLAAVALGLVSCSKDFLDRGSKVVFSDENFWTSEGNVKSYCWEFYNLFAGYGTGTNGDFYFTTFTDDQAARSMDLFPTTAPATNSHWDYTYIRKANLLLVRVPQMNMLSQEAANHCLFCCPTTTQSLPTWW